MRDTADRSGYEYRCSGCGVNGGRRNLETSALHSWNMKNKHQPIESATPFVANIGEKFKLKKYDRVYSLEKTYHCKKLLKNMYVLCNGSVINEHYFVKNYLRIIDKSNEPIPEGYGGW